jgi:uncharacterized membrane protein YkvA (DUF1232 family)
MSKWFQHEVEVYKRVVFDKRTPLLAKICYGLMIGYAIVPFDFVADVIPFFGQLDDVILVPLLFLIARSLTPKEVLEQHRNELKSPKLKD